MGKIIVKNQPCKKCESSDARQVYENGSYCFSCSTYFKPSGEEGEEPQDFFERTKEKKVDSISIEQIRNFRSKGFEDRKIYRKVSEFFGVKVSFNSEREIDAHYYPYANGYKVRKLPKNFSFVGEFGGLFGRDKFTGGGKRLVITEGELDAMSIAQASLDKYDTIYPVVSLPSATATKYVLEEREWIRSFDEVVLCTDKDEAGEEATQKLVRIIGIDKVKIWEPPNDCKDPSDVLVKYNSEKLHQLIWNAQPWSPAGIIKKEELWEALTKLNQTESLPFPQCLEGLNTKVKGIRPGEITLFISGTGAGKSTLLREIMLHILESQEKSVKIGVISLEESPAETARKLAGMQIRRNPAVEEIPIEDLKIGFDAVFGEDRVLLLDHQGSISDSSIVDQMEYMCLMGCQYIFVDHITILVSEGAGDLTGNEAIDKVMNDLLRLVKKHPVWVGLVSHLRKAQSGKTSFEEGRLPSIDDIRGSGSIKQISFDIVAFARDMMANNENERNKIKMAILKSRFTGLTGTVNGAIYDNQSGRLRYYAEEVFNSLD